VEPGSDLGKQFTILAQTMLDNRQPGIGTPESKKRFIEFFSVVPGKAALRETSSKKNVG